MSKSQPVFPPIQASAIESRVVGTISNFAPRLKREDAKAVMSLITPPPMAINRQLLEKDFSKAPFTIESTDSIVLFSSPAGIITICACEFFAFSKKFFTKEICATFESVQITF